MTKIVLESFAGEIPKIEPRYLPPQNGAVVSGARLTRGNLAPMREDLTLTTLGAAATSIYLHGSTWLSWSADVDAVPGPVATERLYLTRSDGAPQMYYGGAYYPLALPGPTAAPGAALGALTKRYVLTANAEVARFTFTNSIWVKSTTAITAAAATNRASATVGQILLGDTTRAPKRLVACLPRNPASGAYLVIKSRGTGQLTIHRNGQTIGGSAADLALAPGERAILFHFTGSTWTRTNIPDPRVIVRNDTSAVTVAMGDNISVDSDANVEVTLPTGPYSLGQVVFVERANRGEVVVKRGGTSATINGATSFTIPAKGDRYAFFHNGTEWKPLRFAGAFDDDLTRSTSHQTVASATAVEFATSAAPRTVLVDLPTATAGQTTRVGAVGGGDAVILPGGLLIEGQAGVLEIDGYGDFVTLTATGTAWNASAADVVGMDSNGTAAAGQIVLAYTARQRVAVTLPDDASAGDIVDVVRIGPRAASAENMAPENLAESVVYAYTWVTSLGEESAPSPVSGDVLMAPGRTATITLAAAAPTGRLITKKRLYRSVTTESGVTDLFFITELDAATTTFTDSLSNTPQEAITTRDFDAPLASLRGLTALPNGIMAAFSGREVYFSEPYIPHAWPTKYSQRVNAEIVGLAALGASLIVLTKQNPWRLDGLHPDSMSLLKIEANFPCLAKRGIVDMGYSAVYPSNDGLVEVTGDGSARLISSALWDREQWRALAPASFRAAQFIGRYAFSHDPLGNSSRRLAFLDLTGEMPFIIPVDSANYLDLHYAIDTGRLIGLKSDGVTVASIDDPGAGLRTAIWESKPFMLPSFDTFSTVKIDATAPPAGVTPVFEFRVYTENHSLLHTITEPNQFKRLPAKLSDEWSFRFVTNWTVQRAIIVGTADELIGG